MKRVRRILFNTLTAISLLLAIATAGLWVRSVFVTDAIQYGTPRLFISSRSANGGIQVLAYVLVSESVVHSGSERNATFNHHSESHAYTHEKYSILPPGFGFSLWSEETVTVSGSFDHRITALPYWAPLITLIALPSTVAFAAIRRGLRAHRGHCPACGYDIRANPEKCSECGHESSAIETRSH